MQIAIFSDIHGNLMALDAVLQDIQRRGGVDEYWVLGDLCVLGYAPSQVLKRLARLDNALFVRGNGDRQIIDNEYPRPTIEQAQADPWRVPILADVRASFGWTAGHLAGSGWMDWLRMIPPAHRVTLPDGTPVQLAHATPDSDDGDGLHHTLSDQEMRHHLQDCTAQLLCVGHFHLPMKRTVDGITVINPGAVSNPVLPDMWPAYAILHADESGYTIQFHRVPYDREAAIEEILASGNPSAAFIAEAMCGNHTTPWMHLWDGVSYLPDVTP